VLRQRTPGPSAVAWFVRSPIQEKAQLTLLGVVGAFVLIVGGGASCVVFGPIIALFVAVFGILVSASARRKRDLLKCTSCGFKRAF
jgi:hypothetical protein